MKRFRSPLQKIQKIELQKRQITELKLAQAHSALRRTDQMIESLEQSRDALERECAAQFLNLGRVSSTAVSSARRCLSHCRHDIAAGLQRREQMRQEVNAVEEEYRGLRVRCDGLEQLINRQKAEHRRQAFLAEQNLLDEAFRSRKFARQTDVADVSGDGDPETTQSGVTEQ